MLPKYTCCRQLEHEQRDRCASKYLMLDRQGEPEFIHTHVDLDLTTNQPFARAPFEYLK